MNLKTITGKSLSEIHEKALRLCKKNPQVNLIITGEFSIEEANSEFILSFQKDARLWQNKNRPSELLFSHGEYIHRFGDGHAYILDELNNKIDSNRAVFSLLNMNDILNSGDGPIPSFLILQFGFKEESRKTLCVTAYFRALEIQSFLPINIAEICENVKLLTNRFPTIEKFSICIHAFRAHVIDGFNCLKQAPVDALSPAEIAHAVERRQVNSIINWLTSKLCYQESIIETKGLKNLLNSMVLSKDFYGPCITALESALKTMEKLEQARKHSSHSNQIQKMGSTIRNQLERAVKSLEIGV